MPPITRIVMDPVLMTTVWLPDAGPASPETTRVCLDCVDDES